MRRCKGAFWNNGKKIPVMGWFHQWAAQFEDCGDAGVGNYTVAIVEQDDGIIVECSPNTVVFLDREGTAK